MSHVSLSNQRPPVNQVANHFLLMTNEGSGDVITNLKLQKLCYFGQAFHFANYKMPMFDEPFEAWAHGPVVRKLWRRFTKFGWQAIDTTDCGGLQTDQLTAAAENVLDTVWDKLGHWEARQLEAYTHAHAPWRDLRKGLRPEEKCTAEITHDAMRKFYGVGDFPELFAVPARTAH